MTRVTQIEAAQKRLTRFLRDLNRLNDELEHLQVCSIRLESNPSRYAEELARAHDRAVANGAA